MPQITLATLNTNWDRERDPSDTDLLGKVLGKILGREINEGRYNVVAAVEKLDADVTHLQEVWVPDSENDPANFLAELERRGYHTRFAPFARLDHMGGHPLEVNDEKTTGSGGVAIVSKIPFRGSRVLDLGHAMGDLFRTRKALEVVIEKDGSPLTLICFHTSRYLGPVGPVTHLRRLRRQLPPAGTPTVVAGDANFWGRPSQAIMRGMVRGVIGKTLPALHSQVDHIFIRPEDVTVSGEVTTSVGSDHLPIKAVIKWGQGRELPSPAR